MAERNYKRMCLKVGIATLLNTVLLNLFSIIGPIISGYIEPFIPGLAKKLLVNADDLFYSIEQILFLLAYLAGFLVPSFIFILCVRKEEREPLRLGIAFKGDFPLELIAAIGIVLISAYVNAIMVSFIDYSLVLSSDPVNTPIKLLISFVSIAIVPALCEEFLFRGCILSYLLPYGKMTALIASSALFALMHGNFAQFIYTFAAGIVLGAVYIESGSIWPSTFIHLFNNFYSVICGAIYDTYGDDPKVVLVLNAADILLIIAGLAALGWVIYRRVFRGKLEIEAIPEKKYEISGKSAFKLFFSPTVIISIVFSLLGAVVITLQALYEMSVL